MCAVCFTKSNIFLDILRKIFQLLENFVRRRLLNEARLQDLAFGLAIRTA